MNHSKRFMLFSILSLSILSISPLKATGSYPDSYYEAMAQVLKNCGWYTKWLVYKAAKKAKDIDWNKIAERIARRGK